MLACSNIDLTFEVENLIPFPTAPTWRDTAHWGCFVLNTRLAAAFVSLLREQLLSERGIDRAGVFVRAMPEAASIDGVNGRSGFVPAFELTAVDGRFPRNSMVTLRGAQRCIRRGRSYDRSDEPPSAARCSGKMSGLWADPRATAMVDRHRPWRRFATRSDRCDGLNRGD